MLYGHQVQCRTLALKASELGEELTHRSAPEITVFKLSFRSNSVVSSWTWMLVRPLLCNEMPIWPRQCTVLSSLQWQRG